MSKEYLITKDVAEHISVSKKTLERWRYIGTGPIFKKFGRSVRYAKGDLDKWVEEQSFQSTSGYLKD
ncbi:MAG: helix-turn-helix domain-containing protein [Hyphomicrobiales bacterium]